MNVKLSHFLQWRCNIFLYLTLGWDLAKVYLFFLGKIYFLFRQKERRTIQSVVKEVIGRNAPHADVNKITQNVFKGIFSHYYEKLYIAFEEKNKAARFLDENIKSSDLITLRRCLLKGNGTIVITGHYGAIEYIPTLLAIHDFDVSMIAKFKTKQLKKKVFAQAEKYKIRLIDGENTGDVLKRAMKELKENRVLITQCDEIEEWRPSGKHKTSFLGQVTGLDRTINIIQKRTGAEVVFGVIHRYNLDKYKLIMYSSEEMSRMFEGEAYSTVGETVLKVLEQFIYSHPDQWYQWKKYPEIKKAPTTGFKDQRQISLPYMKPVYTKV